MEAEKSSSVSIIAMGSSLFSYFQDFESGRGDKPAYTRPTDDVWAINSAGVWCHDVDMIIAMDNFRRDLKEHETYVNNILKRGLPIMTDVADPAWKKTMAYPLREVLKDIWPDATEDSHIIPPIVNTCGYALALAIYRRYTHIRLYGYEFRSPDNAYTIIGEAEAHQDKPPWWAYHMPAVVKARRDMEPGEPCTMFLLGVAHARGITIHIPRGSSFCDQDRMFYHYGYEIQPDPFGDDIDIPLRSLRRD